MRHRYCLVLPQALFRLVPRAADASGAPRSFDTGAGRTPCSARQHWPLSVGYSMVRRLDRFRTTLVGLGLVTLLVAGCGGTASTSTPSQTASQAPTVSVRPSDTAGASGSVASGSVASASAGAPTVSPNPTQTYPLAHVDAALEDQLPSELGGVALTKWSMPVSSYMASVTGGDTVLYPPWLVKFGKTPDEVDMALAQDLTGTQHTNLRAIQVPGADAATLVARLGDVATSVGWTHRTVTSLPKTPVLQIIDPTVDAAKTPNTAFVYAKGDIVFFVISDDLTVVVEALAALP